jgi:hypothetical protein
VEYAASKFFQNSKMARLNGRVSAWAPAEMVGVGESEPAGMGGSDVKLQRLHHEVVDFDRDALLEIRHRNQKPHACPALDHLAL